MPKGGILGHNRAVVKGARMSEAESLSLEILMILFCGMLMGVIKAFLKGDPTGF